MPMSRLLSSAALCNGLLFLTLSAATARPAVEAGTQNQPVNADAKAMSGFTAAVEEYAVLHRKIAATLPPLSKSATPQDIDRRQRELGRRIAAARKGAKAGDLFTPELQAVVRRLMERLFDNTVSRRQLRESVMDDNPSPAKVRVAVNARYPDDVPLSTMPPDVLKNLPLVPKEVEYRFVGETLILLDPDAHVVVDFVTRALPR